LSEIVGCVWLMLCSRADCSSEGGAGWESCAEAIPSSSLGGELSGVANSSKHKIQNVLISGDKISSHKQTTTNHHHHLHQLEVLDYP